MEMTFNFRKKIYKARLTTLTHEIFNEIEHYFFQLIFINFFFYLYWTNKIISKISQLLFLEI